MTAGAAASTGDAASAGLLATGAACAEIAQRRYLGCHIGGVGTADDVRWARPIGATSIDSALPYAL